MFDLTRLSASAAMISRYWYELVKATMGLSWRYLKAYSEASVRMTERRCEAAHVDRVHFVDLAESLIRRQNADHGKSFKVFADLSLQQGIVGELVNKDHFRSWSERRDQRWSARYGRRTYCSRRLQLCCIRSCHCNIPAPGGAAIIRDPRWCAVSLLIRNLERVPTQERP